MNTITTPGLTSRPGTALTLQPGQVSLAQLRAIQQGGVRLSMAASAYERAAEMAPTDAERDFLILGGRGSR